jgi:hypothetical protein
MLFFKKMDEWIYFSKILEETENLGDFRENENDFENELSRK